MAKTRVKPPGLSENTIGESAVLVAVTTCPSLLIPIAANPYEPHKAAFFWACVGVAGVACALPYANRHVRSQVSNEWTRILVASAAIMMLWMAFATAGSKSPALAWWGSALRRQGALTQMSGLAIPLVVLLGLGHPERLERLVTAVVVASVGPTLYGLFHIVGVDPLSGDKAVLARSGSTFGNPLFFAGYLATVWPLTLGRAAVEWRRRRGPGHNASAVGTWALLAFQSIALIAARSRGPALALFVGVAVTSLLLLTLRGRRRLAVVLSTLTVVASVIFLVLAPAKMRTLGHGPGESGLHQSDGTAAVRLILWDAVGTGIRSNISRSLFGGGAESSAELLTRYSGPELQSLEGSNTSPDRAHNETLETLVSFGLVGLILHLIFIGAVLGATMSAHGVLAFSRAPIFTLFAGAAVAGATALAVWSGDGLWAVALGPAAGMVLVAAGCVAVHRPTSSERSTSMRRGPELVMLAAGATAGWMAHFVEIQLGIETIASSLNSAIAMALPVAFANRIADTDSGASRRVRAAPGMRSRGAMAILAGWAAAILMIGLAGPRIEAGATVWLIAATSWALTIVIIGADRRSVMTSAAVWLGVVAVWFAWRDVPDVAMSASAAAWAVVDRISLLYVAAAACMTALTLVIARASDPGFEWRRIVTPFVAGALVASFSIRMTGADVLARYAEQRQKEGDSVSAIQLYQDATARDPSNDHAFTQLATVLIAQTEAASDVESRRAGFESAERALNRARTANPFDYHHPRNLAALQRRWARVSPATDRPQHLDAADGLYLVATTFAPAAGVLWAEWANLDAERRHPADAWGKLNRAAALLATTEAVAVSDALLRAGGDDVAQPAVCARIGADLQSRGYAALAAEYMARAGASQRRR